MTVLTTAATLSHTAFNKDYSWEMPSDYFKPRTQMKPIALPSIRQAIPELFTPSREACARRQSSGTHYSFSSSPNINKRLRITHDEEQEAFRAQHVPRAYPSPEHMVMREISPGFRSTSTATERWNSPSPTSSLNAGIPSPMEVKESSKPVVTLPSLKATMNLEADVSGLREGPIDDGRVPSRRPSGVPAVSPSRAYSFDFCHHQSRYQSHPSSPVRSYDRPLFPSGTYLPHYQEAGRYGDIGMGAETKQRKRRGNLPKETTDKLRAWFHAHLQHPYPTEDEKQELMRQTGLQMNQISNWFINARRRQLPAMLSNARLASNYINAGRDHGREGNGLALGDGDGGSCDEAMDMLRRNRVGSMKRGSV